MLKRGRSKSESRGGGGGGQMSIDFVSLSSMLSLPGSTLVDSDVQSGDNGRKCAFTEASCQVLNELRLNNLLCDAKISTKKDLDRREYAVHRLILAGEQEQDRYSAIGKQVFFLACSPYFRMTLTNMQQNESSTIELDIERDALEALIDYAYTRRCNVTSNNVIQIIDAAKMCQMTNLVQYCCDYLRQNLTDESIFSRLQFCKNKSG